MNRKNVTNSIRYQWATVQVGELPISSEGSRIPLNRHKPTTVVIFPEQGCGSHDFAVLTDPYITEADYTLGVMTLNSIPSHLHNIKYYFLTHQHRDHMPFSHTWKPECINNEVSDRYSGFYTVRLPGHHPDLLGLFFLSPENELVGIVGDAVIDQNWLMAWQYYWPNGYQKEDIIDTWNSVAWIISNVDVVVPGHGPAFKVTQGMVSGLISTFPKASYADLCPQIPLMLAERMEDLKSEN